MQAQYQMDPFQRALFMLCDNGRTAKDYPQVGRSYPKRSGSVKDVVLDNIPMMAIGRRLNKEKRVYPHCGEVMREIGPGVWKTSKLIPVELYNSSEPQC